MSAVARDRVSSAPPERQADGSAIPARLRIVGWIVLATSLGLLAVGLTIRSALLTDVARSANSDVEQEVDEFRTFADRGLDPGTGAPFADAERLLTLHLERQFVDESEVLIGFVAGAAQPVVTQAVTQDSSLAADADLVRRIVDGAPTAGTATTADGDFRWGKAVVAPTAASPGGAFVVAHFTGAAEAGVAEVVRRIALVCLGGLLLTAGIAYAVAGQILAPVRTVRRAASRITRADLGQRIDVRGRDDVAALALTFNAMLDRLQGAFTAQQRFASAAEQHLRGPLAVLADHRTAPAARDEAGRSAAAVLDDLAVLAASEAPDFLSPLPVDLAVLTQRLAAEVRALDRRAWVVEAAADGSVCLDETRVCQAVRRLALNALEQPSDGAPLRLGVALDRSEDGDSAIEIWVQDGGPGFTPERASSVLDRYGDATADAAGAGLGLAVVRAIADAHDGSAWVESDPGHGARVGLRLPAVRPSAHAGDDRPVPSGPLVGAAT